MKPYFIDFDWTSGPLLHLEKEIYKRDNKNSIFNDFQTIGISGGEYQLLNIVTNNLNCFK